MHAWPENEYLYTHDIHEARDNFHLPSFPYLILWLIDWIERSEKADHMRLPTLLSGPDENCLT